MFKCAEIWANKGIMSMKWSFALLFGAIAMPALAQSEQVTPTNCDASAFERPEAISVDMSTFAELKSAARFVFIPSQYDPKLYQSEKRYSQAEVQLFIDTNYVCSVGNKDGYLLIPSMVTSGGVDSSITSHFINNSQGIGSLKTRCFWVTESSLSLWHITRICSRLSMLNTALSKRWWRSLKNL